MTGGFYGGRLRRPARHAARCGRRPSAPGGSDQLDAAQHEGDRGSGDKAAGNESQIDDGAHALKEQLRPLQQKEGRQRRNRQSWM